MNTRIVLLFSPGWTLATGSPHLALPLLSAFLQKHGIEVTVRDLNHSAGARFVAGISHYEASAACASASLECMNSPYFRVEDRLMSLAKGYDGEWNAQLGFGYSDRREVSSERCLRSLNDESPFTQYFIDHELPAILRQSPDIIGFSIACSLQLVTALQCSFLLREAGFSGVIALGGNTVTRLLSELSIPGIFDLVDVLVSYQGEMSLLALCRLTRGTRNFASIVGAVWRDDCGRIIRNETRDQLDLAHVPTPDYRQFLLREYWGRHFLNVVAMRGCYYGKCTFCAIPYGWAEHGFAGAHSPEHVIRDILTLVDRHDIRCFKFVDEALSPAFIASLARDSRFLEAMIEWEAYVRLEREWEDSNFVAAAAKAGLRKVYFGLEILPSSRRLTLKKNDRARPELVLNICAANGIKVHFFCMFGFPGSGEEDAARTTEFVLSHLELIDTVDIFPWGYAKHTKIPGVEPIYKPNEDWALEFEYTTERSDVLLAEEVTDLAGRYEEMIWDTAPRLLHPTYRLVSPWSIEEAVEVPEISYVNSSPAHSQ